MLDTIKRELDISIVTSIIYVAIGLIIVFNPQLTQNVIGIIIGVFSIIAGIVMAILNIANIKNESSLLFAIFLVVMGIAIFIYPDSLSILISLGIGIWFISNSVTRLKFAAMLKDMANINYKIILISAIFTLIIGVSFIFTPLASIEIITILSGVLMIVYSVVDIFEVIFIKSRIKDVEVKNTRKYDSSDLD